ncbi:unnamed protein product [Arctogadus glacialis]
MSSIVDFDNAKRGPVVQVGGPRPVRPTHDAAPDLEDPDKLGAFEIKHEAERGRRGEDVQDQSREAQWCRFERQLQTLAKQFCPDQEKVLLQEWFSFKNHLITGSLKNKSQEELLTLLASEYDEWLDLYPCISLLASIALIVPVSSVNCERDFSAMNRIRESYFTSGAHLALVCDPYLGLIRPGL